MKYTETNSTTAEIKFYGYIGMWWISSKDFADTITQIEAKYKKLDIRLHCYGGECFEGNVIFNSIQRSKLETTFIIDGVSASMSTIVMLAGKTIKMAENAFVMIHAPSAYSGGNANEFFSVGKLLKSLQNNFATAYARRSNKSAKEIEAWFDGFDHWFNATECLEMKLVDEIIPAIDNSVTEGDKPDAGTPVENVFGLYASMSAPMISNNYSSNINNTSMTKETKQALIAKHGLTGVTAESSDTAILDAMDAKIALQDTALSNLRATQTNTVQIQAAALITTREIEMGAKFSDIQKATFNTIAEKAGIDVLKATLADMKPIAKVEELIVTGKDMEANVSDRKTWDFKMWKEKDPEGLDKLSRSEKAEDVKAFAALYDAEFKK